MSFNVYTKIYKHNSPEAAKIPPLEPFFEMIALAFLAPRVCALPHAETPSERSRRHDPRKRCLSRFSLSVAVTAARKQAADLHCTPKTDGTPGRRAAGQNRTSMNYQRACNSEKKKKNARMHRRFRLSCLGRITPTHVRPRMFHGANTRLRSAPASIHLALFAGIQNGASTVVAPVQPRRNQLAHHPALDGQHVGGRGRRSRQTRVDLQPRHWRSAHRTELGPRLLELFPATRAEKLRNEA